MKYRSKVVIEATQWHKNGDHPEDKIEQISPNFFTEGKVVRHYRRPDEDGRGECTRCGRIMHDHGWLDEPERGRIVCPGDFVITGVGGERYPCKPDVFAATYEQVVE